MPTGSCLCGKAKVEWSGEPVMMGVCHCLDCRKISGSNYSNNIVVPAASMQVLTGEEELKTFEKTADSGKQVISAFCPHCGTTLFRYGETFGGREGNIVIKIGIADDPTFIDGTRPGFELYAPSRVAWVHGIEGAAQCDAMLQ